MSTISSLGIGSGIDVSSLISGLMSVEQAPLTQLSKKESTVNSKLSALGLVKSAVSSLSTAADKLTTAKKLAGFTASLTADSSGKTIASATASSSASAGVYGIEVTQLATQEKTRSNTTYSSMDALVGAGTFVVQSGTDTAVSIDVGSDTTLGDLRDSINSNANMSVTATVVSGDSGMKLVLTAKDAGEAVAVSGSSTGASSFTTLTAGKSAIVKIDGETVTSTSNTISSALSGIELKLEKTGTTTLTVSSDNTVMKDAVNAFISAYNSLNTQIQNQGKYDATNKKAAALTGDALLSTVKGQVAGALYNAPAGITGSYKNLSDIGISFQKDGSLSLDSTKFDKALQADGSSVMSVLNNYGTSIKTLTSDMTASGGIFTQKTDGLNTILKDISSRRTAINDRLEQIQTRYTKQFSSMDTTVASMNSTLSYISKLYT